MDYVKLRNIKKILKEVNSWKDDMARLTDRQLQEKTVEFRERLAKGDRARQARRYDHPRREPA